MVRSGQGRRVRAVARLVQGAVRDAARLLTGAAHGLLHRALRNRQRPQAHRRGAGGVSFRSSKRGWYPYISPRARRRAYHFSTFRSEEHTSELQSLMRISYAVFCLKKKNKKQNKYN